MKKIKNVLIAILVVVTIVWTIPVLTYASDENDPYRGCSASPVVVKK